MGPAEIIVKKQFHPKEGAWELAKVATATPRTETAVSAEAAVARARSWAALQNKRYGTYSTVYHIARSQIERSKTERGSARGHFRAQKSLDFQGPILPMALEMDVGHIKIMSSRPI